MVKHYENLFHVADIKKFYFSITAKNQYNPLKSSIIEGLLTFSTRYYYHGFKE